MLTDVNVSSTVRETVIDLLLKNLMHMDGGLPRGWSWRFVEDRGERYNLCFGTPRLDSLLFKKLTV